MKTARRVLIAAILVVALCAVSGAAYAENGGGVLPNSTVKITVTVSSDQ